MNSLRYAVSLTLPVVMLTGCASESGNPSRPDAKVSATPSTSVTADPAPLPASSAGGSKPVAKPQVKAAPKRKKAYPSTINIKPPRNFSRYRAKGAYNVNPLLYPKRDIFGAYVEGGGGQTGTVWDRNALGRRVGRNPSMIKRFYTWGQPYDQQWARSMWQAGAIPQMELESWPERGGLTAGQIASGQGDAYIRQLAQDIRNVNVPVVFSIGHEFNGNWYPWGYEKSNPGEFKAAWKRMHTIFKQVGATNAIWMWSPNQIHARPQVRLQPWYPGDKYVDWVGVIGYYYPESRGWIHTFHQTFDATIAETRRFTRKPIMLAEVGSASVARDKRDIKDFLVNVAKRKDVIGFMWFNIKKEQNWHIEASPAKQSAFRYYIRKWPYAFNPKKP